MSVITQDGDSALMIAAREGRTEVVSLLLEAGANIHIQNKVECVHGGVVYSTGKKVSNLVPFTFSIALHFLHNMHMTRPPQTSKTEGAFFGTNANSG